MKSLDFALLLSKYLTQYLPAQRDLSSNTICSYRDTFKLLLIFCRDIQGFNIAKLPMTQLDRKCIEDFILWLRNIRKSSPSTCNQRLCAIHAFFDYVMVEEPQFMEQCIQIHNIPRMVSPATSFDCSGYVSWVINHSGWNVGRLGAQGLYNICTPTSSPKPGDLVFFKGTYDTPGVSHCGIYVGDGKMLHCGDPIGYANLNTSYWQSHFYAYGRLP